MRLSQAFAEIDSADKEPAETIIKGFTPIGSISGIGGGTVKVTAYEIAAPSRGIVLHRVQFEVADEETFQNGGTASVSLEAAERLSEALSNLANAKISTDRFRFSEVEAKVDDLKITVFNTEDRRIMASVSAEGYMCHLKLQSDLLNLGRLLDLAVLHLRTAAIEQPQTEN